MEIWHSADAGYPARSDAARWLASH